MVTIGELFNTVRNFFKTSKNQHNSNQHNSNQRTYVQSTYYPTSMNNNINDPVIIPRYNQKTVTFKNQVTIRKYKPSKKKQIIQDNMVPIKVNNNQGFELLKSNTIKKSKNKNHKIKRRVNSSNINVNQIIKQHLIPVIVDKLIKNNNNSSERIIQKKFYINHDKTFKDLKDIIESRINITNTININIKLFIYTEDNKTIEIKDGNTLMSTIYEIHKHKNGILYMVYKVLSEKFTIV